MHSDAGLKTKKNNKKKLGLMNNKQKKKQRKQLINEFNVIIIIKAKTAIQI